MWPKISWQTNLTFPGNNLSQTISRSTCHKQNTTSGQVVLQANHPKNPWDLNHPQVPVVPRSSRVDQHTRTFNKITKQHQMECIKLTDPPIFSLRDLFKEGKTKKCHQSSIFFNDLPHWNPWILCTFDYFHVEEIKQQPPVHATSVLDVAGGLTFIRFDGSVMGLRGGDPAPGRTVSIDIPKPSPTKPRSRGACASHGPWASVPARPTRSSFCHRWNSASPIFFQSIFSQSSWATAYQFPENGV